MPSNSILYGSTQRPRRILVVDDNPSIHADFRKILGSASASRGGNLAALESSLFGSTSARVGTPPPPPSRAATSAADLSGPPRAGAPPHFSVDFASQGREGFEAVRRMLKVKTPYALAFVDMRMPPGWDGIETSARIWEADPAIQIVICSAYSDYSWHEVVRRLNRPGLRLLQKPFDTKDVLDLAWSLTTKWLNHDSGNQA
jgi:CheY-like chemotaxis protein